jgi:UDPglucose--hexose-1-phosphate uridylyltransferase
MGELRKDYLLDRYVIVSPERAKRPHDFERKETPLLKPTPFAPGQETQLPAILAEYPQGANWQFRVVPNKFAITKPEGQPQLATDKIYTWANNYGHHEVVVEGRDDAVSFVSLGTNGIAEAIRVAIERVRLLSEREHITAVIWFKNEGQEAGASINHPHSQIVAMSVVTPGLQRLYDTHQQLRQVYGFSPLYKVLDYERGSPRVIFETQHFALLCPYASRFPMEVQIIPLRDSHSYLTMTDEERIDLAHVLHHVLAKLQILRAPYNMEWMHSVKPNGFHWYLSVTPRLSTWAGYEIETNIIVNPIPPEDAAAFYRS